MTRLYEIDQDTVIKAVENAGYTFQVKGATIVVFNDTGRRKHGEIFKCRDGGWDRRLDGNAVRIWERLIAEGASTTPPAPSAEAIQAQKHLAMRQAAKRGELYLRYSDEEIAEAMREGALDPRDALNQDF
jgi:hypothetical protein